MKATEIEFKFNAKEISLKFFKEFCQGLKGESKYKEVSGWDDFWDSKNDEDGFYRIREDHKILELTYKHKTKDNNNYVRDEHNLKIHPETSRAHVETFISSNGYSHNSRLFKNCFLYNFETYTLVYYVCYDEDMLELGRFIEIEMREDYPWPTEKDAWNELVAMERICKPLGISPQSRVKRSLFEMFRKEV
jgi:adenylate cyclase class IV